MLKEKNAKRRCMINVHHQFSNMKTFLWNSDIWIKLVYLLKRNIISNIQIVILKMETFLTVWCNSNILCLKIWIDYWFTLDGFFSLSALQYLVSISLSDRKSIWNGDVWLRKKIDWVFHLNFFSLPSTVCSNWKTKQMRFFKSPLILAYIYEERDENRLWAMA